MRRTITLPAVTAIAVLFASSTHADVVGLTFEGLDPSELINGFYDTTGSQNGNFGPNYGVTFVNARASVDTDAGGAGDFQNAPSPDTVLFWEGATAVLNFPAGFDTGFSFYYSASMPAWVRVYNGLDGFGDELAYLELGVNWQANGCLPADGAYCFWQVGSLGFDSSLGDALSIVFGGMANFVGFDNITFGSTTPVPLPAAVWLLGSALLGFATLRRSA